MQNTLALSLVIACFLVLTLILVFVLSHRKSRSKHSVRPGNSSRPPLPKKSSAQNTALHWGVALRIPAPETACQQALALQNINVEKDKAHSLPLAGCDKANCRCYYEKLTEQRSGEERRKNEDRRESIRFEETPDRRNHIDRRKSGKLWDRDRH